MSAPLIIQIQEAALDGNSSLTDALRKAKIACAKLGLREFGNWIDQELNGYMDKSIDELPEYRRLHGTPEAFNPYQGWQPLIFQDAKQKKSYSQAPIGMTISAIEQSVSRARPGGAFGFPYSPEIENDLCDSLNWGRCALRIKLDISQTANIINAVRNILL
jgi:hypothetical protein